MNFHFRSACTSTTLISPLSTDIFHAMLSVEHRSFDAHVLIRAATFDSGAYARAEFQVSEFLSAVLIIYILFYVIFNQCRC